MGYAFISYSSKNKSEADTIRTLLTKHNIDNWMAPYDIPAGSKYAAVITNAIRNCSCFVLLLSNSSQTSEAVDSEVELATFTYKKSIIVLELEKVILNDSFTFYIHNRQIIALHKIDENSHQIAQILDVIKTFTDNTSDDSKITNNNYTNTPNESSTSLPSPPNIPVSPNIHYKSEHNTIDNNLNKITDSKNKQPASNNINEPLTIPDVNIDKANIPISKSKHRGHLVNSYKNVINISKDICNQPIEISMPDGTTRFFDFCDEFDISHQKKYIIVKQKNNDEYLFFIFRNRYGEKTLVTEGDDQRKIYLWFRKKYNNEYIFVDNRKILKKKKHFAQDTVLKYYTCADNIPQTLTLPEKYSYISKNAFIKLNLNNKEIKQIILPDSVEIIYDNAFSGLIVTDAIYIPKSVKKIGHNAFSIKNGAYIYCEKNSYAYKYFLKEKNISIVIDVPFTCTEKNDKLKILKTLCQNNNITRIKSYTIPYGTNRIEIDEVILPNNIRIIEKMALLGILITKKISIPSSVIKIDKYAFSLTPNAYVECEKNSYAYFYCKKNNIKNSVDMYEYYKSKGLCAYCGGKFIGLFKKKCEICGKGKNYQ